MIPKTIHYCWFGGNPLPELARKCIKSWKKYCPDYEIKRWDETNFDVNVSNYTREAYDEKKWAFVSDYARFWILYHEGGVYFDTDVEVINSIDEIVGRGPFMGVEADGGIAPGLGMGAEAGMPLYREILSCYDRMHYKDNKGVINDQTVVDHTTRLFEEQGWKNSGMIESIDGIYIYPSEYFSPKNYYSGEIRITENTISIHYYSASWHSWLDEVIYKIEKCDRQKCNWEYRTRRLISLPFRTAKKIKNQGIGNTAKLAVRKIFLKGDT